MSNHAKAIVLAVLIMLWGLVHAEKAVGDTYSDTAHGDSTSGVDRSVIGSVPPYIEAYGLGDCNHCHEYHAISPPTGECFSLYSLFMDNFEENKNELCYACHETFTLGGMPSGYGKYGIYQGKTKYEASVHNTSPNMTWSSDPSPPGPSYSDPGNCRNCHNPHGYHDGKGTWDGPYDVIPQMLFRHWRMDTEIIDMDRSDMGGCRACHDGTQAAKDVMARFALAGSGDGHSLSFGSSYAQGKGHFLPEAGYPERGDDNLGRHIQCVDCHNPHTIGGIDPNTPHVHPDYEADSADRTVDSNRIYDATFGSSVIQGVWGVEPSWPTDNWTQPTSWTVLKPPAYPNGAEKEYQICIKCHSYYGHGPGDNAAEKVAKFINPNNKSYHPIVEPTSNPYLKQLHPDAMRNPWKNVANQTMYCTDCHGSDAKGSATEPVGPHGNEETGYDQAPLLRSFRGADHIYWPEGPHGEDWLLGDAKGDLNQWKKYLFCRACHVIVKSYEPTVCFSNVHEDYHSNTPCVMCHNKNPHGWRKNRLIGGDGVVTKYRQKADPFSYGQNDCASDYVGCKNAHPESAF